MLRNVLEVLGEGKAQSVATLAMQLDVSEGLLIQMMEELSRKGYLMLASGNSSVNYGSVCKSCGSYCSSCPSARLCSLNGWVLTEKGLKAINKCSAPYEQGNEKD